MKKPILELVAVAFLLGTPANAEEKKPIEIQNYPNPFDQKTKIEYVLKDSANISLVVFDSHWNGIDTLVWKETQTPGKHTYEFDATGKITGKLPYRTGTPMDVYWYQLRSQTEILTYKKMFKNAR